MPHILITGGAGTLGSFFARRFFEDGWKVSNTTRQDPKESAVFFKQKDISIRKLDLLDKEKTESVILEENPDIILHCAANIPGRINTADALIEDNVAMTESILDASEKADIKAFMFASTYAVYGEMQKTPVKESDADKEEIKRSLYGEGKYKCEKLIQKRADENRLNGWAIFRYTNIPSADQFIKACLDVAYGRNSHIILQTDYNTDDGSLERDYIHPEDLFTLQKLASLKLLNRKCSGIYNAGSGNIFSFLEIYECIKDKVYTEIPIDNSEAYNTKIERSGVNIMKAEKNFLWGPKKSSLDRIVEYAISSYHD